MPSKTFTYTIRDSNQRYMGESTDRREAERAARRAVTLFGGCMVVCVGEEIVSLVESDGISRLWGGNSRDRED